MPRSHSDVILTGVTGIHGEVGNTSGSKSRAYAPPFESAHLAGGDGIVLFIRFLLFLCKGIRRCK